MLTQNSEMRKNGIWNWTLPAWVARRNDGVAVNVCPQAGACVKMCYARNGAYNFPTVKAAHVRNLHMVMDDLSGWTTAIMNELNRKKFKPSGNAVLPDITRGHLTADVAKLLDGGAACVRIHDSGDFFSEEYLLAWMAVASHTPGVLFYTYTKSVSLFKRVAGRHSPSNFLWCYSLGGKEDGLVDKAIDYHADVFPDLESITKAGYYSQHENDLLCVLAPSNRIGIPSNNIPKFKKILSGRTFGEVQKSTTDRLSRRHPLPS